MNPEYKFLAYIDESGGHGFDFTKEGTSKFFIVNAILVEKHQHESVTAEFQKIKNKYFSQSELKSSKIGNKEHIRLNILNELKAIDFKIFSLVVDKRKIYPSSGLQYKESFYKFLYGLLYSQLYKVYNQIEIIADELISNEFVESFGQYIRENHLANLFHQSKITFCKSNDTVLLQLCDVIGGTINRFYSSKSEINPSEIFKDKFLNKIIWPEEFSSHTVSLETDTSDYTKVISDLSLLRIDDYVRRNEQISDNVIKLRVMFLVYLKNIFLYNSHSRFVHTQEIVAYFYNATSERVKEQFIRQHIVGPLRSEGVLIVSNVNGYKIPSSKNDVIAFFNLFSKIISPMVNRLGKAHKALFQATKGELNILEYPEFEYLRKIID